MYSKKRRRTCVLTSENDDFENYQLLWWGGGVRFVYGARYELIVKYTCAVAIK